ncbi:Pre-mRNA-splicing factor dre4 [Escovopsis weberi]|uniref:Pre-mRNA-splicing factor dre4 n=1 Tax=Escovopsis weberi TaxID=150374 RepID=A0A0M9VW74_ESCWE|nr:Pre-mRNA-splicing factor dre4 [Escovopsis weberi]
MSALRSTHKPSPAALAAAAAAPLPPGWTEHKAPTGHTYYFNAATNESTYKRPGAPVVAAPVAPPPPPQPYAHLPSLADPRVANAFLAQFNRPPPTQQQQQQRRGEGRPPPPQPVDRPRRREPIPGCEPWVLVYTKYSRRFVYNPAKNASFWRIPEKLMPAILEMDKRRVQGKAGGDKEHGGEEAGGAGNKAAGTAKTSLKDLAFYENNAGGLGQARDEEPFESDEYEEVEVTDDEEEDHGDAGEAGSEAGEDGHPAKRRRTAGDEQQQQGGEGEGPVEFTEADIAMQLQAMGEQYDLEPGDYDDGNMEDWPEGTEGLEFTEEDGRFLFRDMLADLRVSPYSPWDQLLEDGKMVDDVRYTALSTTKARKDCFDEWARERIAEQREQRARQEKKDPRVAYLAFLQEKATPKLYWPEFKRKYKKEDAMRDPGLADRDREKAYREHVGRLKMPLAGRKADLTALLRAQPARLLHSRSLADGGVGGGLPAAVLADLRYISLEPQIRDPLIEAYVQTLPPPPEDAKAAVDDEERARAREARERRERALAERNQAVEEQRRQRERGVAASKARLLDEERELEMAMRVGKRGLQSQLAGGMPREPSEE